MAKTSYRKQSLTQVLSVVMLLLVCGTACQNQPAAKQTQKSGDGSQSDTDAESDDSPSQDSAEIRLFDGKSLAGWEQIQFGGEGDIEVVDGEIRMDMGDPLTGVVIGEDVEIPRTNYEISLQAMKREGTDFFCGLTFPVGESHCSMIVGGWAGTLVGLSNLDGIDASDNGTRVVRKFERNQWYSIRVRVTPERITCWIDDEQLIDESIVDREVSIRNDVITTTPIGICNFQTPNSIKDIVVKKIQ